MLRKIMIKILLLCMLSFTACSKDETKQISLEEISQSEEEGNQETDTDEEVDTESTHTMIYVYVCGAVNQPGVYELPTGSRAYEAILKAGGFQEDAATTYINQAEILEDETQLYIPTKDEALQEKIQEQSEEDGKINLNKASKEELMTLPGVGESKADSIIEYRKVNGSFQKIEDIMLISGIKEGLFSKIKEFITI